MEKDRICKHCKILFKNIDGKIFSNHSRWCNLNPERNKGNSLISLATKNNYIKVYGEYKDFNVNCHLCKKKFKINIREKKFNKLDHFFCSRTCANTRLASIETKKKISNSIKSLWENEDYINKMFKRNINKNKIFSSKNENAIKAFLKNKYPSDEWVSGGPIKYKNIILSRDIYSNKLKIIIEYDGIWHFKNINNQLERKKQKDKLLNEWCIINNWRIIRISEKYFKNNKNSLDILIDSIYNKCDSYIEFY